MVIVIDLFIFFLGTVRRFLERYGNSIDIIIFVVDNTDLGIYEVLLPLYFPRSKMEEEASRWQLPADLGGEDGEPLLPDRQIRIIDNPQHTLHRRYPRREDVNSVHQSNILSHLIMTLLSKNFLIQAYLLKYNYPSHIFIVELIWLNQIIWSCDNYSLYSIVFLAKFNREIKKYKGIKVYHWVM